MYTAARNMIAARTAGSVLGPNLTVDERSLVLNEVASAARKRQVEQIIAGVRYDVIDVRPVIVLVR